VVEDEAKRQPCVPSLVDDDARLGDLGQVLNGVELIGCLVAWLYKSR
jgi:hypothetical protein